MYKPKPKNYKCNDCGKEQYTKDKCFKCGSHSFIALGYGGNKLLKYEKDVQEFVDKYGLSKQVAKEVCASHERKEVAVILDFLNNYGHMLQLKKEEKTMIEILGNDISKGLEAFKIEAKNTYKSEETELHVWELDEANYEKLDNITHQEWDMDYGWWRKARCLYEGSSLKAYKVNGTVMNGYVNEHRIYYGDNTFSSFTDWLINVFDLGTDRNVTAFATSLAEDNGMTLAAFMKKYQP